MYSYDIKKMSSEDIERILLLFDPYSDKPNSFRGNKELKDWPKKLSDNAMILTCSDGNDVVGCIFYYENEFAIKNQEGYIVFFCVLPDYRRYGIASKMIQILKSRLSSIGIPHLRIRCAKSNIAAFRLYQKMSFDIVNDDGTVYDMVSDTQSLCQNH